MRWCGFLPGKADGKYNSGRASRHRFLSGKFSAIHRPAKQGQENHTRRRIDGRSRNSSPAPVVCHGESRKSSPFRFNARKGNDAGRFQAALEGTIGKRLTYRELAGIDDAGFMGIQ